MRGLGNVSNPAQSRSESTLKAESSQELELRLEPGARAQVRAASEAGVQARIDSELELRSRLEPTKSSSSVQGSAKLEAGAGASHQARAESAPAEARVGASIRGARMSANQRKSEDLSHPRMVANFWNFQN